MTRRALVTGGHGFVAQWAIRAMLDRGWSVTAAGLGVAAEGSVRVSVAWDGRGRRGRRCGPGRRTTSTPAGTPSTVATSAGPCDSPAVNQRSMR